MSHRAIFLNHDRQQIERVFGEGRRARVESLLPVRLGVVHPDGLAGLAAELVEAE